METEHGWGRPTGSARHRISRSHVGSFSLQPRVVGAGYGVPGVHVAVHAHGDAFLEARKAQASAQGSPDPRPLPGQRTAHAQRSHRVAPLIRARAEAPRQSELKPQGSHLLRIVQRAPRLPDALPEALVRHPLWGHANPQPLRPPPGGPRGPRPPSPARPRTCSSSCALATAICTFTCSMMSPGSSLPPPEPPKSELKPSMAPQSQPARGRVRRPVPAPEVGGAWVHGKWSPGVLGAGRRAGPRLPQARRYVGS